MALERARSADAEAGNLFVGAAGWLGLQAKAAAARLHFPAAEGFPVATVGGLWEASDLLLQPFRRVVLRWLPRAEIIAPRESPVQGAARRAATLTNGRHAAYTEPASGLAVTARGYILLCNPKRPFGSSP